MNGLRRANDIAIGAPVLLLACAYGSELFGLVPCEMCWWQRWAHMAAIAMACTGSMPTVRRGMAAHHVGWLRFCTFLAAACVLASGAIGLFHAGVEYGWWKGLTTCSAGPKTGLSGSDFLKAILARPIIRCDVAQWTFAGISLAGMNGAVSTAVGLTIAGLALKRDPKSGQTMRNGTPRENAHG